MKHLIERLESLVEADLALQISKGIKFPLAVHKDGGTYIFVTLPKHRARLKSAIERVANVFHSEEIIYRDVEGRIKLEVRNGFEQDQNVVAFHVR